MQKIQNEILRCCNLSKISDRGSIVKLHARCKIIGLGQRMRKQLLWLMYILSRDKAFHRIPMRVTRSAGKIVFKLPNKITPISEHSPFYVGSKVWDELSIAIQEFGDKFAFKKEIDRMNRVYVKL